MAKIEEIDYDQIVTKASKIASSANNMQNSIEEAFKKIESMRENWFGTSYDNFIDVVNSSLIALNKLFETTVSDIPHEIAAKAKSYAASNQSSTSISLVEQTAIILNELSKTNKGSKLRFRNQEVLADQTAIKSKFKSAGSWADNALSISSSLESDWRSISGDTNIRELKIAFKNVKIIIDNLSNSLDRQISAQSNTIEVLETAEDTVKAAKDILENAADATVDFAASAINKIQESASATWTSLTGKD